MTVVAVENTSEPSHCRYLPPKGEAGMQLESVIGLDSSAHDHVKSEVVADLLVGAVAQ